MACFKFLIDWLIDWLVEKRKSFSTLKILNNKNPYNNNNNYVSTRGGPVSGSNTRCRPKWLQCHQWLASRAGKCLVIIYLFIITNADYSEVVCCAMQVSLCEATASSTSPERCHTADSLSVCADPASAAVSPLGITSSPGNAQLLPGNLVPSRPPPALAGRHEVSETVSTIAAR